MSEEMDNDIVYHITGANKGIGLQLTGTLLLRRNTTVVATKRSFDTSVEDLENLSKAQGSRLIIVPLAFCRQGSANEGEGSKGTVEDLVQRLKYEGVVRIDVLILNAGAATSFESAKETRTEELMAHFEINTVWPIQIYQVLRPLLLNHSQSAGGGNVGKGSGSGGIGLSTHKKIIYISSSLGSIGGIEEATPCLAYGISKAGANYFVRKVHFEEGEGKGIVSLAVHPGWVKTHNGQAFADSVGVEEPPMSLEESVDGVLKQIDTATWETTSGSFVSYDGTVIPW